MYGAYELPMDPEGREAFGTGWLPPLADTRDYTDESKEVAAEIKALKIPLTSGAKSAPALPPSVDLRAWCSPIEHQDGLGSCTAHAGVGVVEYFEKKSFGKHIDASRLFVYKTTRNLMQVRGDTGAWLRTTMGALALCGAPPEKYWPYVVPDFDKEPPSFVYALADNYEALRYFCFDPIGTRVDTNKLLARLKLFLAAKIPVMFGFYGFDSFNYSDVPGGIPFPCPRERARWGHAIVAVGYDDRKKIKNTRCNKSTTGALLIRNSWGTGWGDAGYGWLPYEYVLHRYALDFWALLCMGWVNTGQFGL